MGNLPSLSHTRNTYKALKALGKTPTPSNTRKTVNVVYGSPCAGKTTYVREHAGDDDIIVDADALYAAIHARGLCARWGADRAGAAGNSWRVVSLSFDNHFVA